MKAKKEWWGTYHPIYGLIEKDKDYEVRKEDMNAKMWESSATPGKKGVKADGDST